MSRFALPEPEGLAHSHLKRKALRSPKLRSVPFWIAVSLDVILAIALISVFFGKRTSTGDPAPQPLSTAKATPAPVEPKHEVVQSVARAAAQLWFRIVDETGAKPIALAHVVIDNGNLAPELGDDSDAVTWPDGRAIISHRFFVWEERRGDETVRRELLKQGPWIHVSAEGYEPRKLPLSEILKDGRTGRGPSHEAIFTLRRRRADDLDLAPLATDYTFGDGFTYEHLEISRLGRYHYQSHIDVFRDEPHEKDRHESRGRCSIVNGVLRLVHEGPFASSLRHFMKNDFVPVRWGNRCYLIPEKDRLVFCSAVNQRAMPRYMRSGPFSRDDADFRKAPPGLPQVPSEWASFLLPKPVTGTIAELLPNNVAILSAGAYDGLKAGMELLPDGGPGVQPIKILFTETDRSFVRMSTFELGALPDSLPGPMGGMMRSETVEVGQRFSSRASDPRKAF